MTDRARLVRPLLLLILLAHFALALQFSLRIPLGEAPDEADHWAYTAYLATERRLPEGPALTQAKHPPLYFVGAALFAALGEPEITFFRPNPAVNLTPGPDYSPAFFQHGDLLRPPWSGGPLAFHLARLFSVLLSVGTVAATAALARAALPTLPVLPVAAAGLAAFIPEFLFIGGAVNNDNGAAFFGALALWGSLALLQNGGRVRRAGWTPLALGAGVLSKVSSLALWPVAGVALLFGLALDGVRRTAAAFVRRLMVEGALLFLPALLLVAPLLLRNQRLYGDPLGMSMALQTIDQRTTPWTAADTSWLLRGWYLSFWGKFGGAGHIAMAGWVYWVLGVVCVAALGGLGLLIWRARSRQVVAALGLLAAAVAFVAAIMFRYSLVALGTDQGRLLYPAYAAIVVLLAAGLLAWAPPRRQLMTALLITAATALLGAYALWGVIVPLFAGT